MGTIERKQRQKEEVYDSILKASWKLVKQEGWQGLSIRKIAEEIEYSIPVIYDHFENKEAILKQFTRQGFRLLNEQLVEAGDMSVTPVERLKAVASAYWKFAFANPEFYQLMYGLGMPGCEMVNEMEEVRQFTTTLVNTISPLENTQSKTESDILIKMKSFWSMLHGLVTIEMMAQEKEDREPAAEVLNESIRNFIAGITQ